MKKNWSHQECMLGFINRGERRERIKNNSRVEGKTEEGGQKGLCFFFFFFLWQNHARNVALCQVPFRLDKVNKSSWWKRAKGSKWVVKNSPLRGEGYHAAGPCKDGSSFFLFNFFFNCFHNWAIRIICSPNTGLGWLSQRRQTGKQQEINRGHLSFSYHPQNAFTELIWNNKLRRANI